MLKTMRNGKAKDSGGIIAEMIKDGNGDLWDAVLEMFNDILKPDHEPPAAWKRSRLVVIFKKGDPTKASNYRPIAILPVLYKVFSRLLCDRMLEFIMPGQSIDQAAYRKGFSTDDHLLTLALTLEKTREWNIELWLGLVDFEKAFDTVEHESLWRVLESEGFPEGYTATLKMDGYTHSKLPRCKQMSRVGRSLSTEVSNKATL